MAVSLEGMSAETIQNLAALAKGMSENPETRGTFLSLVKRANPSVSIPEVDIPLQTQAALKPLQDEIELMRRERQERDARDGILAMRNSVIEKGLASKADIPEIENLMLEKGITSHETAAEFMRAQRSSAKPTPSTYMGVQSVPRPDLKPFGGNMKQWGRQTAAQVIDDIRAGRIVAGT